MRVYKGCIINKLQTGYYESYVNGQFWKADTLTGIKKIIKGAIK